MKNIAPTIFFLLMSMPVLAGGLSGGSSTGISNSSNGSQATHTIDFSPGLLTTIVNTKGSVYKITKGSTVDNIEGSAITLTTCSPNPTITLFECGTSTTCASSPVTIGSVTVTAAGTVVDGTITSSQVTAGDYIAWAITAGSCLALDIEATAVMHAN